jgi:hypothetical protein
MNVGDTVTVRATGRRALIVAELPHDRYEVEFIPNPPGDPIDRESDPLEGEGGIYRAADLAPVE